MMATRQVRLAMNHELEASRPALRADDAQLLAVADRAVRHSDGQPVPLWVILEHLHLPTPSTGRREAHARLRVLEGRRLLKCSRCRGVSVWMVTDIGRERLQAADDLELPESPQHPRWRQAKTLAEREIACFRHELAETLRDGLVLLESDAFADSDVWNALGARLTRTCSRVTSATYCAQEWAEPDDSLPDDPGPYALVILGLLAGPGGLT
jgi:hypothetical protein